MHGVLTCGFGYFIQKTLLGKGQKVGDGCTPCAGGNGRLMINRFYQQIINGAGRKIIMPRVVAGIDAYAAQLVPNDVAFGIQRRFKTITHCRTVTATHHIIFTAPDYFHRLLDDGRQFSGFGYVIKLEPAAKATAQSRNVNENIISRNVEQFAHRRPSRLRRLCRPNQFYFIGLHMRKKVHGLQRVMRQKRTLVFCLYNFCCVGKSLFYITILPLDFGFAVLHEVGKKCFMIGSAFDVAIGFVFHFQFFLGLHYLPCAAAYYSYVLLKLHHIINTRHAFGCRAVYGFYFGTKRRWPLHYGIHHALAVKIETVHGLALHNVFVADIAYGFANQLKIFTVFQRYFLRQFNTRSIGGQLAIP